jgi:hypothetical protein
MSLCSYIILKNADEKDRYGANLLYIMCQIIYAHYNNYYICFEKIRYQESLYVQSIFYLINELNQTKFKNEIEIEFKERYHQYTLFNFIVNLIKCDIFTYVKNHFQQILFSFLDSKFKEEKFYFNPTNSNLVENSLRSIMQKESLIDECNKKNVVIHLRYDDLEHFNNIISYEGSNTNKFMIDRIENNNIHIYNQCDLNKFFYSFAAYYYKVYKKYDYDIIKFIFYGQLPICDNKINALINEKFYDYDVKLISYPNKNNSSLKYNNIGTNDIDGDIFCLSNTENIVLSRSTFSLISLFFSKSNNVFIPYFNIATSLGLTTKYDKNKYNYY